jgi:hypothetical protein
MAPLLTNADLEPDAEPVLGVELRRRLARMDAHAAEAERFVEATLGDGRRRRTVVARVASHRCPPVWCSECGCFVVRRMTADELRERDRGGRAILAEG